MSSIQSAREAPDSPPSLLRLTNVVLKHRRLVAAMALVPALLVGSLSLIPPRTYTVFASFTPQANGGNLSRLAGLAAQFGLNLPSQDPTQSIDFYADLLGSDQLARQLVASEYAFEWQGDTLRGNLITLYDIQKSTEARSREAAVERLRGDLDVTTGLRTALVKIAVRSPYPDLSLQIARRALDLVNEFNLQTRQSQASAERRFVEGRLQQIEGDLRSAEDRMQAFLQQNRDYSNSPQLTFQHDRLQRDIDTRQQVYTSLAQNYEQARIDEVRDTPVITVVERPIIPAKPDGRRIVLKVLLALILGSLIGGAIAVSREMIAENQRLEPQETEQWQRLRSAAWSDIRHPWRALRESLSRSNGDITPGS